jgi:hypothetical protein
MIDVRFLQVFQGCNQSQCHFFLMQSLLFLSTFGDIFDEPYFIQSLAQQVRILRELPKKVLKRYRNATMIYKIPKVQAWSLPRFYLEIALPELLRRGYVPISAPILIKKIPALFSVLMMGVSLKQQNPVI